MELAVELVEVVEPTLKRGAAEVVVGWVEATGAAEEDDADDEPEVYPNSESQPFTLELPKSDPNNPPKPEVDEPDEVDDSDVSDADAVLEEDELSPSKRLRRLLQIEDPEPELAGAEEATGEAAGEATGEAAGAAKAAAVVA